MFWLVAASLAPAIAAASSGRQATLVQTTDSSARCLDGSPYKYYISLDPSGSRTDWSINIQGGGWCYTAMDCALRALTRLGTSTVWPNQIPAGSCPNGAANCNWIQLYYCDGASFSGWRDQPYPVHCTPGHGCAWPGENSTNGTGSPPLYFSGIRNLEATINDLLQLHGLNQADNVVLSGGSAGGLSTFLHVDRVASMVPHAFVTGMPVCGFFLDHGNAGPASAPGEGGPNWTYPLFMKNVFEMQNASGSLSVDCQEAFGPDEAWKCIMAPHAAPFVKTPWFSLQSRFDKWQLGEITFLECMQQEPYHPPFPNVSNANCSKVEQAVVDSYGAAFMAQFDQVVQSSQRNGNRNGAFLDACIIHGSTTSTIDGLNNHEAFQQWWAASKRLVGSATKSWWTMQCPDATGKLNNVSGPCDTAQVCVPWKEHF